MSPKWLLVLSAGAAAAFLAASAFAGSNSAPVLGGTRPPYGAGFGQVKPHVIYLGGDETGLVCDIHWLSWGRQLAVGTGKSWYINSHQSTSQGHAAPAVVVLYHLGIWRGRSAYLGYDWYYPGNGNGNGYGHLKSCVAPATKP